MPETIQSSRRGEGDQMTFNELSDEYAADLVSKIRAFMNTEEDK